MNVSVESLSPDRYDRWDKFVAKHPLGWVSQGTAWQRTLQASFDHIKGHFLALIVNGEIRAGLPLYEVRSALFGNRLVSIPFATLSDPLVSSTDEASQLFDGARKLANELKIESIEIRTLHATDYFSAESLGVSSFYKHHFIRLDRPIEAVRESFHRSCVVQRIARAMKSEIDITYATSEADLRIFYELYVVSRKRLGLPPQPYRFIKAIWSELYPTGKAMLLMASKSEKTIGCMLLLKFGKRVSAEFAVYDSDYVSISPLHRMFWEAIQNSHREGFMIFDFGRTSPDNVSLMDFKSRWGTEVMDLHRLHYPSSRADAINECHSALHRTVLRKLCKIAPRPVFVGIGDMIYNHMS